MESSTLILKPKAPPPDEIIYCIYSKYMSFVKLGRTAGTIKALCKRYRTTYPEFQHYTFLVGPDSTGAEQHLFSTLKIYRIGRTETFTCTLDIALDACRQTQKLFLGERVIDSTLTIRKYRESSRLYITTPSGEERLIDVSIETMYRLDYEQREMDELARSLERAVLTPPEEEVREPTLFSRMLERFRK